MKTALINYITENKYEYYRPRAERMAKSFIDNGFTGAIMLHTEENTPCCPKRINCNYPFKAYLLENAYNLGFRILIWSDSLFILNKNIDELYKLLKQNGGVFVMSASSEDYHWSLGQWITDEALAYYGLTRAQAFEIPHLISGLFALDTETELGKRVFDKFILHSKVEAATSGLRQNIFDDETSKTINVNSRLQIGNRPDQNALTIICNQEKIKAYEGIYADPENGFGYPKFCLPITADTLFYGKDKL